MDTYHAAWTCVEIWAGILLAALVGGTLTQLVKRWFFKR